MTSTLLDISPAALRGQADALETQRQQQLDIMKRLRVLVLSMDTIWKGEAQTAFVNGFLAKQYTMDELSQTLEDYIQLAKTAADEAEQLDSRLHSRVRGI